ncbi:hypothetical protein ACSNOI_33745, partial [Actinomadura kijaniata]
RGPVLAVVLGGAAVTAADLVMIVVRSTRVAGHSLNLAVYEAAGTLGMFVLALVMCVVTGLIAGGAFALARVRAPLAPLGAAVLVLVAREVASVIVTLYYGLTRPGGISRAVEGYLQGWTHLAWWGYLLLLLVTPGIAAAVALLGAKRAARAPAGPGPWGASRPPAPYRPPFGQPPAPGHPYGGHGHPPPGGTPPQPPAPGVPPQR